MKPALPTKKMALGVDPDIMQTMAAVKEVAQESNIPTVVHPKISTSTAAPSPVVLPAPPAPLPDDVAPVVAKKVRGPKPAPVRRTSVDLPVYVIEQIRSMAYHDNKTKRRVILEALRAGGLTVKDIDLEEGPADA